MSGGGGSGSVVLDCEDVCPECGNDYWNSAANGFVGARVEDEAEPICKRCEAQGLESGTLLLNDSEIAAPRHLVFLAVARPHVSVDKEKARIVTVSFEEVRALPVHTYDIAIVEDLAAQKNGVIWKTLQRGAPEKDDFLNTAFLRSIWEKANINSIRLYSGGGKEIAHIYLFDYCSGEFEDFEQAVREAAWHYSDNIFIGTDDDAAFFSNDCVVPHVSHTTLYFNSRKALRWYGNAEEVEQRWKKLDMLRPEQYELKRAVCKKRKHC